MTFGLFNLFSQLKYMYFALMWPYCPFNHFSRTHTYSRCPGQAGCCRRRLGSFAGWLLPPPPGLAGWLAAATWAPMFLLGSLGRRLQRSSPLLPSRPASSPVPVVTLAVGCSRTWRPIRTPLRPLPPLSKENTTSELQHNSTHFNQNCPKNYSTDRG
jgi:hypothetical protein